MSKPHFRTKLGEYADIHKTAIPLGSVACGDHFERVMDLTVSALASACDGAPVCTEKEATDTSALLMNFLITTFPSMSCIQTSGSERGFSHSYLVFLCWCYNTEIVRIITTQQHQTVLATDYSEVRRMLIATAVPPIASYTQHDVLLAWRAIANRHLSAPSFMDNDANRELMAYRTQLHLVTACVIVTTEDAVRSYDYSEEGKDLGKSYVGTSRLDMRSSQGLAKYTSVIVCGDDKKRRVVASSKYNTEIMTILVTTLAPYFTVKINNVPMRRMPDSDMDELLLATAGVEYDREKDGAMPPGIYRAWLRLLTEHIQEVSATRRTKEGELHMREQATVLSMPPGVTVRHVFDSLLVPMEEKTRILAAYRPSIAKDWIMEHHKASEMLDECSGIVEDKACRLIIAAELLTIILREAGAGSINIVRNALSFGYQGVFAELMHGLGTENNLDGGNVRVNAKIPPETRAMFSAVNLGATQRSTRWEQPPLLSEDARMPRIVAYGNENIFVAYRGGLVKFDTAFEALAAWLLIILHYHDGIFANDPDVDTVDISCVTELVFKCLKNIPEEIHAKAPAIRARTKHFFKRYTVTDIKGASAAITDATSARFLVPPLEAGL